MKKVSYLFLSFSVSHLLGSTFTDLNLERFKYQGSVGDLPSDETGSVLAHTGNEGIKPFVKQKLADREGAKASKHRSATLSQENSMRSSVSSRGVSVFAGPQYSSSSVSPNAHGVFAPYTRPKSEKKKKVTIDEGKNKFVDAPEGDSSGEKYKRFNYKYPKNDRQGLADHGGAKASEHRSPTPYQGPVGNLRSDETDLVSVHTGKEGIKPFTVRQGLSDREGAKASKYHSPTPYAGLQSPKNSLFVLYINDFLENFEVTLGIDCENDNANFIPYFSESWDPKSEEIIKRCIADAHKGSLVTLKQFYDHISPLARDCKIYLDRRKLIPLLIFMYKNKEHLMSLKNETSRVTIAQNNVRDNLRVIGQELKINLESKIAKIFLDTIHSFGNVSPNEFSWILSSPFCCRYFIYQLYSFLGADDLLKELFESGAIFLHDYNRSHYYERVLARLRKAENKKNLEAINRLVSEEEKERTKFMEESLFATIEWHEAKPGFFEPTLFSEEEKKGGLCEYLAIPYQ